MIAEKMMTVTCDVCRQGTETATRCHFCDKALCPDCLQMAEVDGDFFDSCKGCKQKFNGRSSSEVRELSGCHNLYTRLGESYWREKIEKVQYQLRVKTMEYLRINVTADKLHSPELSDWPNFTEQEIWDRSYCELSGVRLNLPYESSPFRASTLCPVCHEYTKAKEYLCSRLDLVKLLARLPETCPACQKRLKEAKQPRWRRRLVRWLRRLCTTESRVGLEVLK